MKQLIRVIKLALIFVCLCLVSTGDIRHPDALETAGTPASEATEVTESQSPASAAEKVHDEIKKLGSSISRNFHKLVSKPIEELIANRSDGSTDSRETAKPAETAASQSLSIEPGDLKVGAESATPNQPDLQPSSIDKTQPLVAKIKEAIQGAQEAASSAIRSIVSDQKGKDPAATSGEVAPSVGSSKTNQHGVSIAEEGQIKSESPAKKELHEKASNDVPNNASGSEIAPDNKEALKEPPLGKSIKDAVQNPLSVLSELGKAAVSAVTAPKTSQTKKLGSVEGEANDKVSAVVSQPNTQAQTPTSFFYKSVQINGAKSVNSADLDHLVSLYTGRELKFEQVLDIPSRVEAFYRKQGLFAKVVIAPQGADSSVLRLDVIESELSNKQAEATLKGLSQQEPVVAVKKESPASSTSSSIDLKDSVNPIQSMNETEKVAGIGDKVAGAIRKPLDTLSEIGSAVAKTIQAPIAAASSAVDKAINSGPPDQLVKVDEELTVNLKRVEFRGLRSFDQKDLQAVVADYTARDLRFDQLLELTTKVEEYYRKHNKIARVIMPPQNLEDSVLKLDVLESTLSEVRVEEAVQDLPKTQDHVLALIEGQQKKGALLDTAAVERGLGLANDVPGVSVTGGLKEGDNESETELILKLYANKSRQQEVMLDNFGSNSTGVYRVTGVQSWINPRDLADKLTATEVITQGSQYVRMAYDWASGTQGWRTGVNLSHMTYQVVNGLMGVVGASGEADTVGVAATYPMIRSPGHDRTAVLSFDQKYYTNISPQGFTNSQYRVSAFNANVNGVYRDLEPGGRVVTYDALFAMGNVDLNGSMNQIMDASGANTGGVYAKVRFSGTLLQPLNNDTSFYGSYRIQQADKNLDGSERMGLGGVDGVRAYPNGEGSGSDIQLLSLELRRNVDEMTQISGFYDVGYTNQQHNPDYPGSPTPNSYFLQGIGASITRSYNNGTQVKATWARRLGDNPNPTQTGNDQDGTLDRNRFWLQVAIPF